MIVGDGAKAFDLSQEKDVLRDRYELRWAGKSTRSTFGQCCLVARRLVERGVPYITINYLGWDTHKSHFQAMQQNLPEMDKGMAAQVFQGDAVAVAIELSAREASPRLSHRPVNREKSEEKGRVSLWNSFLDGAILGRVAEALRGKSAILPEYRRFPVVLILIAIASAVPVPAEPAGDTPRAHVTEDDTTLLVADLTCVHCRTSSLSPNMSIWALSSANIDTLPRQDCAMCETLQRG